jgi:hypothetical protein
MPNVLDIGSISEAYPEHSRRIEPILLKGNDVGYRELFRQIRQH